MKKEIDILKLIREITDVNPEFKKMVDEDEKYKSERKKFHLDHGDSEEIATTKMWDDYWKKAFKEDGIEFSIQKLSE